MAMTYDPIAELDAEVKRAESAPRKSGKPIFLFLKENQKALVRPLYNLNQMIVLMKHNMWSENKDFRVNSVCGHELDKTCLFCERVKEGGDKKLTANKFFYVPVYVHSVIDTKSGEAITYKEKGENDEEVEKPVKGFRLLELSMFGSVSAILKHLRGYYRDEDTHDITECDFSIEQIGAGQKKSFTTINKKPSPINPAITAKKPTLEAFRESIIAALPCKEVEGDASVTQVAQGAQSASTDSDDVPDF